MNGRLFMMTLKWKKRKFVVVRTQGGIIIRSVEKLQRVGYFFCFSPSWIYTKIINILFLPFNILLELFASQVYRKGKPAARRGRKVMDLPD
jgi:hypothetical protein